MVLGLVVLTHLGVAGMTPILGLFGTDKNAYLNQYVEDIDSPTPPPRQAPTSHIHTQPHSLSMLDSEKM